MAIGNYQVGSFSNTTLCPIQTDQPLSATASAGGILTARYHITAGSGVSAGSVTFQELGGDGVWRTMQDVTALSLTGPGEFAGTLNGPCHGLRIALGAVTGGSVTYAELIGATLT